MKKIIVLFLIFGWSIANAQQDILQESIDYLLQGKNDELVNIEDATEQLRIFLKHPININNANVQQLTSLPIISHQQAEQIIEYRTNNGNIISIFELKHVSFSPAHLELLKHYLKTQEQSQQANTDIIYIARVQQKFEEDKTYLGNQTKIYSRLKYLSPNFQVGFTIEKDQGEEFLSKHQPNGFDFYSAYLMYQKGNTNFIVGDFTINNGQGLVLSNAFRSIYNSSPLYSNLFQNQIKTFTSTNENSFFRGFCYQRKIQKFTFQPFISFKKIDASIIDDTIKSLPKTGYHRTISELEKKDLCTEISLGNTLSFQHTNLSVALNQFLFKYNLPFIADSNYYKNNNPIIGWQGINSLDFSYRFKNINLFGEFALNNNYSVSFIGGLAASLNKVVSCSIRTRKFGNNSYSPYAYTFSQNTQPTNEQGIDFSLLFNLKKNELLNLNYDIYQHPHIKYGIKRPSYGKEFSLLYQKTLNDKLTFYCRYLYHNNAFQFDKNEIKLQSKSHQIRSQINWRFIHSSTLSFRTELRFIDGKSGWLSYINIKHKIKNTPFDFYFRYTIFNIQDYSARIYAYENDVIYSSATPAYSALGNQLFGMLKFQYNSHLNFWIKFSTEELKVQLVYEK